MYYLKIKTIKEKLPNLLFVIQGPDHYIRLHVLWFDQSPKTNSNTY